MKHSSPPSATTNCCCCGEFFRHSIWIIAAVQKSPKQKLNMPKTLGLDASTGAGLSIFIEKLQAIDSTTPMAKLNAISISDNNGGRIKL